MRMTTNTLMAVLAVAGTMSWQSQSLGAERAQAAGWQRLQQFRERMQDAAADLDLTNAQKEKLKAVFQGQMEKLREVWQDPNLSREEKMEKFKALRTESEPKLKGILTPEQMQKWQQRQTPSGGRMQDSVKDLNLTDEQKAKLKAIFQPQLEKLRDLRADQNLSPQEKMGKMKALRDEYEPRIKEVLTPEQYAKWEKTRGQMMEKARERWQQGKTQ